MNSASQDETLFYNFANDQKNLPIPLPHFLTSLLTQNHSSETKAFEVLVFHYFSYKWQFNKAYFVMKQEHFKFCWVFLLQKYLLNQTYKTQISKNYIYKHTKKYGSPDIVNQHFFFSSHRHLVSRKLTMTNNMRTCILIRKLFDIFP